MKRLNLLLLLPFLFFVLSCTQKPKDEPITEENKNIVSTIQLKDLNNQPIDLTHYKGKTIFLNFWATWCRPCIEEMPSIASTMKNFQKDDIVFLFASNEDVKRIKSFQTKNNYNLTFIQISNLEELNIQILPTTYIINADGELVFSESGLRKWDDASNVALINQIITTE